MFAGICSLKPTDDPLQPPFLFLSLALPGKVVEQYERQGLVARVDGNQDIESVFRNVVSGLKPVQEKEVLDANRLAVDAVCTGDLSAYAEVGAVPCMFLFYLGLVVTNESQAQSPFLPHVAPSVYSRMNSFLFCFVVRRCVRVAFRLLLSCGVCNLVVSDVCQLSPPPPPALCPLLFVSSVRRI